MGPAYNEAVDSGDPRRQYDALKTNLLQAVQDTFPIQDKEGGYEVRLRDARVEDDLGVDDIRGQLDARLKGKTWGVPVRGTIDVVDTKSGKTVVSKPNTSVASIPKLTRHYSYIVGGKEQRVANQWRLRPGPYVKATNKPGEYEAQFQLAKGPPFSIKMDPSTSHMYMSSGSRKIPLYSVLSATGIPDSRMEEAWGKETLEANKKKSRGERDLRSLYEVIRKRGAPANADMEEETQKVLRDTALDPDVAKQTLETSDSYVSPDTLFRASEKLMRVSAGKERPDPIDSLRFKELWTAADHFSDRVRRSKRDIHNRVRKSLGKKSVREALRTGKVPVRDVVMPDLFQKPIMHVFAGGLAGNSNQINPVSMLSDRSYSTIRGPGGIENPNAISASNTAVDPSQLGYVDPIFTPESGAGETVHLALGTSIRNRKPYAKLYNLRTEKLEDVPPDVAASKKLVLPDQVHWKKGKPVPISEHVKASDENGEIRDDIRFKDSDYVLPSAAQAFAVESNLVPFLQNDSAHRTTMSARHMAQSISIDGREPPKVQVEAAGDKTFEDIVGSGFLAHRSPAEGTVESVESDGVVVRGKDGKKHRVDLYDHYPLNDPKAMLHSTPRVKPGDAVKKGQLLADNNFTKDGVLSLGTNLRTAYIANGANHEDGVVISEGAAKKLGSSHLLKPSLYTTPQHKIGKKPFLLNKPTTYERRQLDNIGDDGVVRPGTRIQPGDPLVLALQSESDPTSLDAKALKRIGRKFSGTMRNAAMTWDHDYPGEVVRVSRDGKNITAHVRTQEPAGVGSKVSTRHSAKGIVADVLPDNEMPVDKRGTPMEMLLNPLGVPGRLNAGQILETAAGRIADKTGKPYRVKNFEPGTDYLKRVKDDLKRAGIPETEELYDPKTGKKLGNVTAGPHYAFQLVHQIDKKSHVRHGGGYIKQTGMPMIRYDNNMVPRGGGHTGAQSLGSLGVYGALAAGLRDNLREMQTSKSDYSQAQEVWGALNTGDLLPPPQVPFVYNKFKNLLNATGVNVDKVGSQIRLVPRTDRETQALSRGEIKKPQLTVRAKDMAPDKDGLFDPQITGGKSGQHWGHIRLAESMPNPLFEDSIANTLGVRKPEIEEIVGGKAELGKYGSGGKAIRNALKDIDVDSEMQATKKIVDDPKTKGRDLALANSKYKALRNLKDNDLKPDEAWTMQNVPVLPPLYRPHYELPDGSVRVDPLNQLYRKLGMVNDSLRRGEKEGVPYNATLDTRRGLYSGMKELFGTTPKSKKALDVDFTGKREVPGRELPGVLHMISGEQPKDGFFQDKLIGKKQDYTARSTIVADPGLGVDEIGVPKKIGLELFRPLLARRLGAMGMDPIQAHTEITKRTPSAVSALERESKDRPVLIKRDPVLHSYGLVGQNMKLTDSPAIKVSPLILPPIGGDVDGDTVAMMLPLSRESVEETKRLLPSQRPIGEATGDVMYKPTNESALALYRGSLPRRKTNHRFNTLDEAEKAFRDNKIEFNDVVTLGQDKTTLGRARIAEVVPDQFRSDVLKDLDKPFDKKRMNEVLDYTAKKMPKNFEEVASGLSRLGFKQAYESGHSITLGDLEPLREGRDALIQKARNEIRKLKNPTDDKRVEIWNKTTKDMHRMYSEHNKKHPTNISDMAVSGIKAKPEQFQGMVMAPMLLEDHLGVPNPSPSVKSFSEGVDLGGYWLQSAGARRGVQQKTVATREPGKTTKLFIQANMDQPITAKDCETQNGVMRPTTDRDIVDRHLASPVKLRNKTVPAGTTVTPDLVQEMSADRVKNVAVRSPLKCRQPQGVCSICMGNHPSGRHYEVGENVGIISSQALGERATQIMLKKTHGAGLVPLKKKNDGDFDTVQRLFMMSKPSAENAVVAPRDGEVRDVRERKHGGFDIHTTASRNPFYSRNKPLSSVRPGLKFRAGEQLTEGKPNVHDLLKTRGLDSVQDHMVKEIGDIYEGEGVLRRHVELAVRNATNTSQITDPGDHPNLLRGDFTSQPFIDEVNRTALKGKRPIKTEPVLKSLVELPHLRQMDWMGRLQHDRLAQQVMTAAQRGDKSDIHGLNPIPGLAYGSEFGRGTGPARY